MIARQRTAEEPTRTGPSPALVALLSLAAFTSALNATLLSPLLPAIAGDLRISDVRVGQLAAMTAICGAITALAATPSMDRRSRRFWLRFESALLFVGTALSVVAPNFALLAVARALTGIGGAIIIANCMAATGELIPDAARRNAAIGVIGTGTTLGAIGGLPIVAELNARAGWRAAIAFMLPLAAVVFVGARLLPGAPLRSPEAAASGLARGLRAVAQSRPAVALLAMTVALNVVWFGWLVYFGAFAERSFGVDAHTLSALFIAAGLAEIAANNATPLALRTGRPRLVILIATAALAADLLGPRLLAGQNAVWTLFPFIAVASFCCVVLFTTVMILLLDEMPTAQGAVMSLNSAGVDLGSAAGAALVGVGLARFGDYPAAFALLAAVLLLLPALLAISGAGVAVPAVPAALESR